MRKPPARASREPDRDEAEDGGHRDGVAGMNEPQVVPVVRDQDADRDRSHGEQAEEHREACRAIARAGPVTTA